MEAACSEIVAASAAGIPDIRRVVYSLRSHSGRRPGGQGADIRDIQDVLRHANFSATQIYTQMAGEELRKKLPRRFMGHRQLGFSPDVLEQSPTFLTYQAIRLVS